MEADQNSGDGPAADGPVVGLTGARFGGAAGRRRRAVAEPPEEHDGAAAKHQAQRQHEDQVVGQTGARFPSVLSRWLQNHDEQEPEQQEPEQQVAKKVAAQQPQIAPPAPEPAGVHDVDAAAWDGSADVPDLVRPYFWTGGRTAAQVDLAIEALISATGRPPDPPARPEHRTILGLCSTPRSVAELAALLKMPLGVARVLLGDLAATGSVSVHRTAGSGQGTPDVVLMQRVLTGLRRL
ncbi:MAG TPA: DUF742 domain-containing protein [Pseudonocardiaceae bacterium]|nr:DUF742 domain-containing protein [Pseudonocardiaceae bacterium]